MAGAVQVDGAHAASGEGLHVGAVETRVPKLGPGERGAPQIGAVEMGALQLGAAQEPRIHVVQQGVVT